MWPHDTFCKSRDVYRDIFSKANTNPNQSTKLSLNKLLKRKSHEMTDDEYEQMKGQIERGERNMWGNVKTFNQDGNYSKSLELKNQPEDTRYRESARRLANFHKSKIFIEEILKDNEDLRYFITKSYDDFVFDEKFVLAFSEFIGYKCHNMKETEAIDTSDTTAFMAIFIEGLQYCFSTPESKYENGMGVLYSPLQVCMLKKLMAFFLKYEIRHITEIEQLQQKRNEWEAKDPRDRCSTAPTVPKYWKWGEGTNWVFSDTRLNRRYYGKEQIADAFEFHSNTYSFRFIVQLFDQAKAKIDEDEARYSPHGFVNRKELLRIACDAVEIFAKDANMSTIRQNPGQGTPAQRNPNRPKRVHFIEMKKWVTEEVKVEFYRQRRLNRAEPASDEDPTDTEAQLEAVVTTWFRGFIEPGGDTCVADTQASQDALSYNRQFKKSTDFFMKSMEKLLVKHLDENKIEYKKKDLYNLSNMKPLISRADMVKIWRDLSASITKKITNAYSQIMPEHGRMVLALANVAIGELTSVSSSLGIEREFRNLICHSLGNRFPSLEFIRDAGRNRSLLVNRFRIGQILTGLPEIQTSETLRARLEKFYPGGQAHIEYGDPEDDDPEDPKDDYQIVQVRFILRYFPNK